MTAYEDFLTDPDSVDANWRSTFQQLPGTGVKPDQSHSQTREYFRRLATLHVTLQRSPTLTPM
ncbi:2-oxoglutarate dehydrogenase E1 subunit family protein [Escherichia coli]